MLKPITTYYDIKYKHPTVYDMVVVNPDTGEAPMGFGKDGIVSSATLTSASFNFDTIGINTGDKVLIYGYDFLDVEGVNSVTGSISISPSVVDSTGNIFAVGQIANQMYSAWQEILNKLDNYGHNYTLWEGLDEKFRTIHIWETLNVIYRANIDVSQDRFWHLEDKINVEIAKAWDELRIDDI